MSKLPVGKERLPERWTRPHPTRPGELCNERLVDAFPDALQVRSGVSTPPSRKCFSIQCRKCRTRYVMCIAA